MQNSESGTTSTLAKKLYSIETKDLIKEIKIYDVIGRVK